MSSIQRPPIILTNVLVFILTAAVALIAVPIEAILHGFDWVEITCAILITGFTGMSITAGYHRLWSHKSYEAHIIVRYTLAIGGAMALQNSILHWASDHRVHHRHVDVNDRDPYSAKRGFWFSHIGWMLREYQATRYNDYSNCKDLQKDPVVMWQHKHYLVVMLSANVGFPLLLGWLNSDIWGMLLLAGFARLVFVHHTTFFINSLAHIWGRQPYTDQNSARDNDLLAFLTYGEGYHNYHHIFEYDYRNGIRWWQFDPTKWFIYACSLVGLTKNLRRCPEERIEKARAAMQLLNVSKQLDFAPNADEIKARLVKEYDILVGKMTDYYAAKKVIIEARKARIMDNYEKFELDFKYKELKQALELQKRKWLTLSQFPMQLA